jgi:two-component system chemotaxis response regulator CheB
MPRNSVLHGSLPCVEGDTSRFRCHLGHAYGAELMSAALHENLRRALASAVRALEERVAPAQKLYKTR